MSRRHAFHLDTRVGCQSDVSYMGLRGILPAVWHVQPDHLQWKNASLNLLPTYVHTCTGYACPSDKHHGIKAIIACSVVAHDIGIGRHRASTLDPYKKGKFSWNL